MRHSTRMQMASWTSTLAGQVALADRLREPLARAGAALSDDQLNELTKQITAFRDTPPRSGLIRNLDELRGSAGSDAESSRRPQAGMLSGKLLDSQRGSGGSAHRVRPAATGDQCGSDRAGGDAGLHCFPF